MKKRKGDKGDKIVGRERIVPFFRRISPSVNNRVLTLVWEEGDLITKGSSERTRVSLQKFVETDLSGMMRLEAHGSSLLFFETSSISLSQTYFSPLPPLVLS